MSSIEINGKEVLLLDEDRLKFDIRPIYEFEYYHDNHVICFVPFQGFQSCQYYNGSKTWKSMITKETVSPTHYLHHL